MNEEYMEYDTETMRMEDSTYTERLEDESAYGEFIIVLDVEVYHSEGELE